MQHDSAITRDSCLFEPPKNNKYFNWRLGREFYIRRTIIALDLGILYRLNNTSDTDWDRLPSVAWTIIKRFKPKYY
ncbi:MAG: hypothetical protein MUO72_02730 [Bacteroidales bacterium]|nr:hypothetical protein [Bacteroidales bacterium]